MKISIQTLCLRIVFVYVPFSKRMRMILHSVLQIYYTFKHSDFVYCCCERERKTNTKIILTQRHVCFIFYYSVEILVLSLVKEHVCARRQMHVCECVCIYMRTCKYECFVIFCVNTQLTAFVAISRFLSTVSPLTTFVVFTFNVFVLSLI